jgi:hypothetical protein
MASSAQSSLDNLRPWIEGVEAVLVCVVIVMMTSPGLLLLGVPEDPNAPENPAFRLYWIGPYLIILAWRRCGGGGCWPAIRP